MKDGPSEAAVTHQHAAQSHQVAEHRRQLHQSLKLLEGVRLSVLDDQTGVFGVGGAGYHLRRRVVN